MTMPWLVRGDWALAGLEMVENPVSRVLGPFDQTWSDGVTPVRPDQSVQTLETPFPVDVADMDADLQILGSTHMDYNWAGRPVRLVPKTGGSASSGLQVNKSWRSATLASHLMSVASR